MTHAMAEKGYKGMGMEGFVARWYADLTRKSMQDFEALARRMANELPPPNRVLSRVLEVAPGPGYFAVELAKLGFAVTGLDISHTFVEIARGNAEQAGVRVDFRQGDAAAMPFGDESFDFLLCRAAFKNFTQPVRALEEMHRVLRPGGRAVIIDLRRDASPESIRRAVDCMDVSAFNRLLTKLTFRFMLLKRAYTTREFEEMVAQTEFAAGKVREDGFGMEIWLEREPAA